MCVLFKQVSRNNSKKCIVEMKHLLNNKSWMTAFCLKSETLDEDYKIELHEKNLM